MGRQKSVAHRSCSIGQPDARKTQGEDTVLGARIEQVAPIVRMGQELLRNSSGAKGPGAPHLRAEILESIHDEAGLFRPFVVFRLGAHTRQAAFTTDRLEEQALLPWAGLIAGEPSIDGKPSSWT